MVTNKMIAATSCCMKSGITILISFLSGLYVLREQAVLGLFYSFQQHAAELSLQPWMFRLVRLEWQAVGIHCLDKALQPAGQSQWAAHVHACSHQRCHYADIAQKCKKCLADMQALTAHWCGCQFACTTQHKRYSLKRPRQHCREKSLATHFN